MLVSHIGNFARSRLQSLHLALRTFNFPWCATNKTDVGYRDQSRRRRYCRGQRNLELNKNWILVLSKDAGVVVLTPFSHVKLPHISSILNIRFSRWATALDFWSVVCRSKGTRAEDRLDA